MGTSKRLFVFVLALIALLLLGNLPVGAQGDSLYVCRDPRFAWVRLEFHNIPAEWQDLNGVGWWYLADGAAMYGNTLVADALTADTRYSNYQLEQLGIGVGSAIVGKGDYTESLVGNEHSLLCDPALSPIQDEALEIVLTPEPSPPEPSCPAIAIDYGSMQWYCYTPNASGVIPVPPAPK